jgi:hypothetical protein
VRLLSLACQAELQTDIPNGSLSLVLPLYDTDLVFLVGGPPSPLYAPNKVFLYSLSQDCPVASLEFSSLVLGLAARRDRLVVVLPKRVVLFALPLGPNAMYREGVYETCENPKGLACMATESDSTLLCFPGRQAGQVALVKLPPLSGYARGDPPLKFKDPPFPATSILLAHTTSLSALCCTPDGRFIATASIKGTLIRVWDSKSGQLIRELRRGSDSADIFSLAIHPLGLAMAAASDKGTVHIWDLSREGTSRSSSRTSSSSEGMTLLKPYLPKYFSSSWSDAQFRLPPPEPSTPRNLPFLDILAEEKREKALTTEDDPVLVCWTREPSSDKYHLVAITHSGGWFKLGLLKEEEKRTGSTASKGEEWGAEGRCELVDFKNFASRDGW